MRRVEQARWLGGWAPATLALVAMLALAGCGAATATAGVLRPTATPTVRVVAPTSTVTVAAPMGPCPNRVLATATVPPAPAPTPLAAAGWTAYSNTAYHYALSYPASWYAMDVSATTNDFKLLNYDPRAYRPQGDALAPAPYNMIEIIPLQATEGQTPAQFYATNDTANPLGPPECSRTTEPLMLAGHDALRIVQWPAASGYGPPMLYPAVHYYVATGAGRPLLSVSESYSPGGQPSAAFATLMASLSISA